MALTCVSVCVCVCVCVFVINPYCNNNHTCGENLHFELTFGEDLPKAGKILVRWIEVMTGMRSAGPCCSISTRRVSACVCACVCVCVCVCK